MNTPEQLFSDLWDYGQSLTKEQFIDHGKRYYQLSTPSGEAEDFEAAYIANLIKENPNIQYRIEEVKEYIAYKAALKTIKQLSLNQHKVEGVQESVQIWKNRSDYFERLMNIYKRKKDAPIDSLKAREIAEKAFIFMNTLLFNKTTITGEMQENYLNDNYPSPIQH
jgi:hypothetical protein